MPNGIDRLTDRWASGMDLVFVFVGGEGGLSSHTPPPTPLPSCSPHCPFPLYLHLY